MNSNVIDLAAWKAKHKASNHWRVMTEIVRHKTLSIKEALEYIAFAVWHRDLPKEFDGEITCEMNDDGSIEVYAIEKSQKKKEEPLN